MREKRAAYDQFGHDGLRGGPGGPGGFGAEGFGDIFGDVFGDIFGGGVAVAVVRRCFAVRISGMSCSSTSKRGRGDTRHHRCADPGGCETCDGSGAKKGSEPVKCTTCGGVGQVRMQQGFFSIQQTCPACKGAGTTISDPCDDCHGRGRVRKTRRCRSRSRRVLTTATGFALRRGRGRAQWRTVRRSLRRNSRQPHKIFEREGANLSCEVPVSIATATLGGEVELPTLDGNVSLKVPAGTQSGKVFRLRGKGVTTVRDPRQGDLFATVAVETPVNLTAEQKELLEKFDQSVRAGGEKHSPRAGGWLDTVKRFFERISQ